MRLFIGCSSSDDISKSYFDDCSKYLEELFKIDNDLVFGAYNKGLMGLAYQKAIKYERNIIGITPEIFKGDAIELDYTNLIITKNISRRTDELIKESDALLFLPGGVGTIYELFTVIESKRSGEFNKPIIIYNSNSYFDKLLLFLDNCICEKFTSKEVKGCYYVSKSAEDTINYLNNYKR